MLADPFLPRKINEGREDEIVRCLRCFTCMAERAVTSTRRCTVNPLIGREMEGDEIRPVSAPRKVLVAGGGPGGLYAAYTAARRGHQVILCEKEKETGGILKSEQALPFKYDMYRLSGTYRLLAERAGVEIRTGTEVTPEYVEKEEPYALIIAVGSEPLVPPIKGLNGNHVILVNNYYLEKSKVTDRVVVLGGGLAGCECAVHLGMEGRHVEIVERCIWKNSGRASGFTRFLCREAAAGGHFCGDAFSPPGVSPTRTALTSLKFCVEPLIRQNRFLFFWMFWASGLEPSKEEIILSYMSKTAKKSAACSD